MASKWPLKGSSPNPRPKSKTKENFRRVAVFNHRGKPGALRRPSAHPRAGPGARGGRGRQDPRVPGAAATREGRPHALGTQGGAGVPGLPWAWGGTGARRAGSAGQETRPPGRAEPEERGEVSPQLPDWRPASEAGSPAPGPKRWRPPGSGRRGPRSPGECLPALRPRAWVAAAAAPGGRGEASGRR